MSSETSSIPLTAALEDYLETIYELVRDRRVARVRDIAKARNVKAGSVSPALKRLSDLGLIRYEQREFIELTTEGETAARRVFARHQVLASFLEDFLGLPGESARADACAMEHQLSDEAMDGLVRFLEYLRACPQAGEDLIERFHRCKRVHGDGGECDEGCPAFLPSPQGGGALPEAVSLAFLSPGRAGRVVRVTAQGPLRQGLLDKGVLPGVLITIERLSSGGDRLQIRIGGYAVNLTRREAMGVEVHPVAP
ncbi:MAG: iron dependent repressor, metal binding and dimerization domain protein [Polyangia bacterium]|jgi:DtxR family Mn-dependent transcriptional regulator|nr:iron dependent repressor, metal binding and dimerization domain protein [Polyangia bacterium]